MWLATVLRQPPLRPFPPDLFASALNFGPGLDSNRTVREVVTKVLKHWPGQWEDPSDPKALHEAIETTTRQIRACHADAQRSGVSWAVS